MSMDSLAANRLGVAGRSQEYGESLLNALKSKLEDRAGEHANILESLTPKVRKRVEALRQLQSRRDELEAKFLQERAVLEAKYQKLYEPLDTERYYIVNGVKEVEGVTNEVAADEQEKGVPRFWVNAMKTLEVLAEGISERDEAALQYLKDIKWHRIENSKGFKLEFFFDTNPFFKNEVLTKTYHMIDEDGLLMEKATGTEIKWYPGKCLTQVLKKMPDEGLKNAKPNTETETCESFFNFFSPPQVPEDDDDMDEETAEEELKNRMEQDYEVGSNIRDKIIPHAVCWFTGEAAQDEFEAMDDDEEDDEDEDDEDEDEGEDEDDDEDDDDDDEEAVRECRKKKGGRAPVGDECEFPPECKLQ